MRGKAPGKGVDPDTQLMKRSFPQVSLYCAPSAAVTSPAAGFHLPVRVVECDIGRMGHVLTEMLPWFLRRDAGSRPAPDSPGGGVSSMIVVFGTGFRTGFSKNYLP